MPTQLLPEQLAAPPVMVLVNLRTNNKIMVLVSPVNWEVGRGGHDWLWTHLSRPMVPWWATEIEETEEKQVKDK